MKKKKVSNVILWVLTVFMLLFGIVSISEGGILSSLLFLLVSAGCCPIVLKKLKELNKCPDRKIFIPILIALFFVGCILAPVSAKENTDKADVTVEMTSIGTEQTTEVSSTVEATTEETVSETVNLAAENSAAASDLKVSFIDVGQADSILIQANDKFMLVDAGNNEDSTTIINYLKSQGVNKLDYVIGTHPHEDHVGSLDTVIKTFEIGTIIMPQKQANTKTFEDVLDSISAKGLSITKPVVGTKYELGSASFTILSPNKSNYGDELNNWSVGIKLVNGNNSFVMCGDAEEQAESDIVANGIDISADVLKVGHHGSATSTLQAFLNKVNPTYAVISCGKNNSYGHPTEQTLNKLNDKGIQIFRTDDQGTIIATSDGNEITWNAEPTTDLSGGTGTSKKSSSGGSSNSSNSGGSSNSRNEVNEAPAVTEAPAVQSNNDDVKVHITKTGKRYHTADCTPSLRKSDIVVTLKEAKAKGLTPCEKCNPPR